MSWFCVLIDGQKHWAQVLSPEIRRNPTESTKAHFSCSQGQTPCFAELNTPTLYCVETSLVLLSVCTPTEDLITGSLLLGSICSRPNLQAFPVLLKCPSHLTGSSCNDFLLAPGRDVNIFSAKCSGVPVSDSNLLHDIHCLQDVALLPTVKGNPEAKLLGKGHPDNVFCILGRRDLPT